VQKIMRKALSCLLAAVLVILMIPQARDIVFAKEEITGTGTTDAITPLSSKAVSVVSVKRAPAVIFAPVPAAAISSDGKASPSPSPASGVKGAVRLPGSDNILNTWIFYLILIAASSIGLSVSLLGLRKKWTTHK